MDVFSELMRSSRGYLREAAASAARELGLFESLPLRAESLHESLRVEPRRLRALVRVLLLEGILLDTDGLLRKGVLPAPRALPREGWGRLAEVIRQDRPLPEDGAGEPLRRFHDHLRAAGAEPAREVAMKLGPRGPLLDLGGGAGAYAAAFLHAWPGERAIVADRAPVLQLAREAVPGAELAALDLLGPEPWPPGARVALFANVLHLFPARDAARLVARAARNLLPGGTVAVKDFAADSEAGILFSLNMALFTAEGEVHAAADLQTFLRDAGLRDVRAERLLCAPECLLVRGTAP